MKELVNRLEPRLFQDVETGTKMVMDKNVASSAIAKQKISSRCPFYTSFSLVLMNEPIKDHLHWQCLLATPSITATLDCTCLGHLGQCDKDRIICIYVALPKAAKACKY